MLAELFYFKCFNYLRTNCFIQLPQQLIYTLEAKYSGKRQDYFFGESGKGFRIEQFLKCWNHSSVPIGSVTRNSCKILFEGLCFGYKCGGSIVALKCLQIIWLLSQVTRYPARSSVILQTWKHRNSPLWFLDIGLSLCLLMMAFLYLAGSSDGDEDTVWAVCTVHVTPSVSGH